MKKGLKIAFKALLAVFTAIFTLTALGAAFFLVCDEIALNSARTLPAYGQTDIAELLAKTEWTDEDYDVLYHQTGLGRSALDDMKDDPDRILTFQSALFYDGEIRQEQIAFTTKHDRMKDFTAPIADLQDGDVIVTSTCHTFGWRNGHAAIVTSGATNRVLQSFTLGEPSSYGSTGWFRNSANFIVLRLKDASREQRAEIALWACERLHDVPYSVTVGIFSSKNQGNSPQKTHCSHLVWQAYYHFGYDIDSDGGPVVTARDIANSPYFEVVQVYGFDPDQLW